MDLQGEGTTGAHGGSGLSAFGGSIRKGELNASAPPILHALKFELHANEYYYCSNSSDRGTCFRWPAVTADGYAVDETSPLVYNGSNPVLQQGSLLAIRPEDHTTLESQLKSEPARRILRALVEFGAYLVDDAAGQTSICMEEGVVDEVKEQYGGLDISNPVPGDLLFDDFYVIFRALQVVDNNAPGAVGGGGDPVVVPPLPLCPKAALE